MTGREVMQQRKAMQITYHAEKGEKDGDRLPFKKCHALKVKT